MLPSSEIIYTMSTICGSYSTKIPVLTYFADIFISKTFLRNKEVLK